MENKTKLKQGSRKFYCLGQVSISDKSFSFDNDSKTTLTMYIVALIFK